MSTTTPEKVLDIFLLLSFFKLLLLFFIFKSSIQPWVFFGGNDAKAEAPVLWPPHAKS